MQVGKAHCENCGIPAGEAYRERMCSFVLRGYRAAAAEMPLQSARRPSVNAVVLHANQASRAASFVPNESFDEHVGMFVSFGAKGWSEAIDEWTQLYVKLGAAEPQEWALRRAASHWSECGFDKPFRPETVWKTFPAVTPRARHFAKHAHLLAAEFMQKRPHDRTDERMPAPMLELTSGAQSPFAYVHNTAFIHAHSILSSDPLADDESLAADYLVWFANALSHGDSRRASEIRSAFASNRLTDIVAEKAFLLRLCAVYAAGERLDTDPEGSEFWVNQATQEYARLVFPQLGMSRRGMSDVTSAYVYLCRTSRLSPKQWALATTEELRRKRIARIVRLGTQADHPDDSIPATDSE